MNPSTSTSASRAQLLQALAGGQTGLLGQSPAPPPPPTHTHIPQCLPFVPANQSVTTTPLRPLLALAPPRALHVPLTYRAVPQPLWDVLPYHKFSVRVSRHNLHRLLDILEAVTPEQLRSLQEGVARHHRRVGACACARTPLRS